MVWVGGSSKMMTPGRDVDVRLDDLEDRALPGNVGLGVEQALLHVLKTAHGEEVVGVVVVEGCLFA